MNYFEYFSVTVPRIYSFHPKFRLLFGAKLVLLYMNENAKSYAQLSRSSCYRLGFLCLSFRHLLKTKQIVKVQIVKVQLNKRCFEGRLEEFFRVS